eukprot:500113_1
MESEYGWDYYYFVNNSTAASSSAKSAVQSYLKPIQHQFKNGDICIMTNPTEIVAEHNGQLVEVIEIDEFGYELGGVQQPTVKVRHIHANPNTPIFEPHPILKFYVNHHTDSL